MVVDRGVVQRGPAAAVDDVDVRARAEERVDDVRAAPRGGGVERRERGRAVRRVDVERVGRVRGAPEEARDDVGAAELDGDEEGARGRLAPRRAAP